MGFQNSKEAQEYDLHDSQAAKPYQFQNSKEGQEYNLHDSEAAKPYQFRNSKEAIEYYRKDSQAAAQEYYRKDSQESLPYNNVQDAWTTQNSVRSRYGEKSLQPSECGPRCSYRCSATSHKKPCLFFCEKCCATCLCVPPGTFGNKEVCPCYNNWRLNKAPPSALNFNPTLQISALSVK